MLACALVACGPAEEDWREAPGEAAHKRVVVLGIDGLDPDILAEAIARFPDRMQNFAALVQAGGGIHRLQTTSPPQSPVAWSSFITGQNPGTHGVFDFIHRDPETYREVAGAQRVDPGSSWALPGSWRLPLGGGLESNRSGLAFWTRLADVGVPSHVWRMPIHFPLERGLGTALSGMLTPAVDSAYGQASLFSTQPATGLIGHKKVQAVRVVDGRVRTRLRGPRDAYRDGGSFLEVPLDLFVGGESGALALELQGQRLVLVPGQWSVFLNVHFDALPLGLARTRGIVRFLPAQHRTGVGAVCLAGQLGSRSSAIADLKPA